MAIAMLALLLAEVAEDLISYVFLVRLQIAAQRSNTFFKEAISCTCNVM